MKLIRKVIYVVIITTIAMLAYTLKVEATTVKVTEDSLNLREKASTSSEVLTVLSKDTECEFIKEDGDWYKVKYKTYTGYVSSKYTKLIEEDTNNTEAPEDGEAEDSSPTIENNEGIVTAKLSKSTSGRILPLINSNIIENFKKGVEVTIITETTGWSYVSTDKVSAWVRSDSITGKKTEVTEKTQATEKIEETSDTEKNTSSAEHKTTNKETSNDDDTAFTQKTMYTNETYVNVRKKPSTTAEVLMVLTLNTKITVIGESGEWYKVQTTMGDAYISKKLLSENKKETTSRGTTTLRKKEKHTENTTTTATKTTTTTKSTTGDKIVAYAKTFLNVPYVYGGASPSGFDCSGFTMYVYKKFGISMKHGAQAQAKLGTAVTANKNSASSLKQNLKVGDLVFFLDYQTMDEIGHCGIYIGNGNFIHASSGSGYCVKINSLLPGEYYNTRYCAARRVI